MEKLPKFQTLGLILIIRCNEREVATVDDEGNEQTHYEYDVTKVCKTSSRDERIEAIIKAKYPTYGSELAAIHKGGDAAAEYMAHRELAKQIATESFNISEVED